MLRSFTHERANSRRQLGIFGPASVPFSYRTLYDRHETVGTTKNRYALLRTTVFNPHSALSAVRHQTCGFNTHLRHQATLYWKLQHRQTPGVVCLEVQPSKAPPRYYSKVKTLVRHESSLHVSQLSFIRHESYAHVCTRRTAHERLEIANQRGLLNPLSENTKHMTAGPEKPKRYLFTTPRARRPALWEANMGRAAK